jgi:hypothetical protein
MQCGRLWHLVPNDLHGTVQAGLIAHDAIRIAFHGLAGASTSVCCVAPGSNGVGFPFTQSS